MTEEIQAGTSRDRATHKTSGLAHIAPGGHHPKGTLMSDLTPSTVRQLSSGGAIPMLGFGTYLLPERTIADAVEAALDIGYRHIDTAETYRNERGVGEGLHRRLDGHGLARDEVFVTTKLWPGSASDTTKSTSESLRACNESLDRLGLDYVDLYLIHAPISHRQRIAQWQALVELRQAGRARAIGVSNYSQAHIEELAAEGLPLPDANQLELHPWSQQTALVSYLEARSIVPIAYSSLMPLSTWRSAPGHASGKTDAMRAEGRRADSPIKALADKHGVTQAQLLLRWGLQRGFPVIPKSSDPSRMRENADVFDFRLDNADMDLIGGWDRGTVAAWGAYDPMDGPR